MFVVKPLEADFEPRAFSSPKAANEWAQTGACAECRASICEIYSVETDDVREAVAKVQSGQARKVATVHRRLNAAEIEELERRDAIVFLKSMGLD
jgi:hypothetical protein